MVDRVSKMRLNNRPVVAALTDFPTMKNGVDSTQGSNSLKCGRAPQRRKLATKKNQISAVAITVR